jgi:hypothetical protein
MKISVAISGSVRTCDRNPTTRRPVSSSTALLKRSSIAQFGGLLGNGDRFVLASEHHSEANGHRILAEYDGFLIVAAQPEVLTT